ncbi:MAG: histidine ammonia-lyase [Chitinophagales bacterium]
MENKQTETVHKIGEQPLTLQQILQIEANNYKLQIHPDAIQKITHCRNYLDEKVNNSEQSFYGINTGFGHLYNVSISKDELSELQRNLLLSHACGMGEEVPLDVVKWMLFLKIQSLSYGHSGVQLKTVERLVDMYNHNVLPIVYQQGSLGASGDLAPLAHLSIPLLGEGEVWYQGEKKSSKEVWALMNWETIDLQAKEGLALINGTQFMGAYGVCILLKSQYLSKVADFVAAVSLEAFDGRIEPFLALSHQIRPHKGQLKTAQEIRRFVAHSQIIDQAKAHVQDPYSFRCVPQVHGASKDTIAYVQSVFEVEVNSVTDNPNIFPEEDRILSAGNFHGQPLALTLDFLALALAELGSISERRTYKLLNGERNLPSALSPHAGLHSGLMIPQYTAASIVSQNKQLCTSASIDSITSSKGQEDHVSMGANAATKCHRVVNNLERILAVELLTAFQALDFRKQETQLNSSELIEAVRKDFREMVSFNDGDRLLRTDLQQSVQFIQENLKKHLGDS